MGDVPLITTSHDGEFENKPRDSKEDILAFVEQELLAAARDLPYQYSQNDPQQAGNYYNEDSGRWAGALARKLSAYAILAHVSAWQGKYADAAVYAKVVLDNYTRSGHAYLNTNTLTNSNGFFMGRQNNHLFALNFLFEHLEQSFTGHIEELTLARPVVSKLLPDIYIPKDTILSIFDEPLDERFSLDTLTGEPASERYFSAFNTSVPIFSKIKVIRNGVADPTFRMYSSAVVFTRLEDIALLRAEALAALNDPAGAIELLNSIRGLRALPPFEEGDGDLVDAIFKERKRELLGEGWHWYDMVRYMKIKRNSAEFQKLIDEGGIYWPIAGSLLTQNPELVQTPYWK
ncbi:RagB/SusD family nutrient uptake outer membrane protein [Anseongella ginsenosidimutans]|uniref:RagB/SusD family nutrient uptake outer membrane protein n=1 Tax=Anseongella ginsenosidimutans TaxID=496056 RepID=UPI001CEF8681|nr:RagB/SusD family nutrient uptake outer membrane protein [Anseongella ginsenosidimutans]